MQLTLEVDTACNFLMDECFVKSVAGEVVANWHAWKYAKDVSPIAGYAIRYQTTDFLTVRVSPGILLASFRPGL